MSYTHLIVLLNLTLSAVLTGLIWTIQVVHYPGFLGVGTEGFLSYQHNHMRTISYVVIPLMLAELVVAFLLPFFYTHRVFWVTYLATGLVVAIWLSTLFISSPLHSKLASEGYDALTINRLVTTNWIRTVAWSARTGILFYIVSDMMKS